jgi:hypothetical protein
VDEEMVRRPDEDEAEAESPLVEKQEDAANIASEKSAHVEKRSISALIGRSGKDVAETKIKRKKKRKNAINDLFSGLV